MNKKKTDLFGQPFPTDKERAEMVARWEANRMPRDYAETLLGQRFTLLDMQLDAIKRIIACHEKAREAEDYQFDVLDTDPSWDGDRTGGLETLRDERFWKITFQASAHSMAAVGMLAPFIESLFVAIFNGLEDRIPLPPDSRRHTLKDRDVWNPQWYAASKKEKNRKDILLGIKQLTDATGLKAFLPLDHEMALDALFAYRNNMFHNGFEWPDCRGRYDLKNCPEKKEPCKLRCSSKDDKVWKFNKHIEEEQWPESWFELAERDGKPWLFYMSPDFCAHCVTLIDGIIDGTGRYLKDRGG